MNKICKKKQINFSACQHFEEKVLNPILESDKYRITNILVFFQTIRKLLGHHFTWLHNECCVRFSKLKFRPSAGFSAWFRDHTGSGGPGFRTKGATACATFELPVAGAAALFCTANASPLHTNNCARHSWQRQRREHLHWCKLKKTSPQAKRHELSLQVTF